MVWLLNLCKTYEGGSRLVFENQRRNLWVLRAWLQRKSKKLCCARQPLEGWRATTTRICIRENQRFLGVSRFVGEAVCEGKGCFAVLWGKNEEPLVALDGRWERWRATMTRKTWGGTLNRRRSCDLDIEEKQRRVSETKPRRNA